MSFRRSYQRLLGRARADLRMNYSVAERRLYASELRRLDQSVMPMMPTRCVNGHALPRAARYCPVDGLLIPGSGGMQPLPERPNQLHCRACRAAMDKTWTFCILCGLPAQYSRQAPLDAIGRPLEY